MPKTNGRQEKHRNRAAISLPHCTTGGPPPHNEAFALKLTTPPATKRCHRQATYQTGSLKGLISMNNCFIHRAACTVLSIQTSLPTQRCQKRVLSAPMLVKKGLAKGFMGHCLRARPTDSGRKA